jgi:hypothetical protein
MPIRARGVVGHEDGGPLEGLSGVLEGDAIGVVDGEDLVAGTRAVGAEADHHVRGRGERLASQCDHGLARRLDVGRGWNDPIPAHVGLGEVGRPDRLGVLPLHEVDHGKGAGLRRVLHHVALKAAVCDAETRKRLVGGGLGHDPECGRRLVPRLGALAVRDVDVEVRDVVEAVVKAFLVERRGRGVLLAAVREGGTERRACAGRHDAGHRASTQEVASPQSGGRRIGRRRRVVDRAHRYSS